MQTKSTHKIPVKLVGWWIKLTMISLVAVDIAVTIIRNNPSFAQPSGTTPPSIDVVETIATTFGSLGTLVGILAVVVIVVAGIIYAFDLGGGKQSGLAKEMIISAISGVILYMLSRWLLTELGSLFAPTDLDLTGGPPPGGTGGS